ncbi:ATP-binding protein [Nonomuraea sp. SYSU D8015]|uniref:ATP-binding protein n=1 Tax=Nonomuraea sp. SYSU D8015 TaxID=2593644 RepID=UPI001660B29F|nr:ATP-binding protein [Nonomuraea sp. SYSU D8015]
MSDAFELRCPVSDDLAFIRDLVRFLGEHSGLCGERLEDLVLAVNEAVTNVLDHGGKAGIITVRRTDDGVTVEIRDLADRLSHDHLAGAHVDPTASGGFGLWVIQHLCDRAVVERTEMGSLLRLDVLRRPAAVPRPDRHFRHDDHDGHDDHGGHDGRDRQPVGGLTVGSPRPGSCQGAGWAASIMILEWAGLYRSISPRKIITR